MKRDFPEKRGACPLSWLTVADMTENNKKLQQQIDELLNRYNNQRDYEEE